MKTIVVGYDDDAPAKRALERAADLAAAFQAELVITSVTRIVSGTAAGPGIGPYYPVDMPEIHRAELTHAVEYLAGRGIEADCVVTVGDPATEILELAESRAADLIVVGTREAGFLERLLEPSVSGAVQRRAHCDVLIVH